MHVHAVLVNLVDDAPSDGLDLVVEKLSAIVQDVPGLIAVWGGPNLPDHPSDYTHAMVVLMESRAVLAPYRAHPRHAEAIPLLTAIVGSSAPLDLGDA